MNHDELEKYLETNIPPSEVDYTRARELLRLEEEKLQLMDSLVEDLTRRRNQINNRLHSYKNIISVARRFPPEIVAAIFRCSIALEPKRDVPSPHTAPLLLTQICSAWRQIALRTQELWNHIHIRVNMFSNVRAQVSLAQDWMERCRTLPYTLSLFISGTNPDFLSKIFSTQPTTLEGLVISLPYDQLRALGNLPAGMTFPALRSLIIYPDLHDQGTVVDPFQPWPDTARIFESALRLQSVEIILPSATYDVWGLRLPWHQLTDLKLHRFYCYGGRAQPEDILDVLEISSCLRTCAIALIGVEFECSRVVELPHLERLDVDFTRVAGTVPFFDSLHLPNLRELRFGIVTDYSGDDDDDDDDDDDPFSLECLAALQRRSKFDLQRFAISGANIVNTTQILSFLTLVPNLQSIFLTFMHCVNSELITALTYDDDRETLLPNLTEMTLTIFLEDEGGITYYLEKMIRSRMRSVYFYEDDKRVSGENIKGGRRVANLETLKLGAASRAYFTEGEITRLKEFLYDGLQLSIKEDTPFFLQLINDLGWHIPD